MMQDDPNGLVWLPALQTGPGGPYGRGNGRTDGPAPGGPKPGTGVPGSGRGLQTHYIQAVVQMVNATMRRESVVGYELMNEPLPGLDIDLWHFGSTYLYPFYARLIQALTGVRDGLKSCDCIVTKDLDIQCVKPVIL